LRSRLTLELIHFSYTIYIIKIHLIVKTLIEKRALAARTNKIANHEPGGKEKRGVPLNCLCFRNKLVN